MRDLDRSTDVALDDMLLLRASSCVGNVAVCCPHPLNGRNDLLVLRVNVLLLEWILFTSFALADLQLQDPLI
jgi:hypothetical protein